MVKFFSSIPVSYFSLVLGIAGLGGTWRMAHLVWSLPSVIGEIILGIATCLWMILLLLYLAKWIYAADAARAEAAHPIQCCFVALVGIATMLIAAAVLPYSRSLGELLFCIGAVFTVAFAVWRTGVLWQGSRDLSTTTAILYLPSVGGSFVAAIVASALGYADVGKLAFGAGVFSWLAIESVILHRLYTIPLPAILRPTMGIQLAPPAVGSLAYLDVTSGPPGLPVYALLGYGILQALVLLRMLPWIRAHGFAPSYWAFSFGISALGTSPLVMMSRGEAGVVAIVAPALFVAANIVVGVLVLGTLGLVTRQLWEWKALRTQGKYLRFRILRH